MSEMFQTLESRTFLHASLSAAINFAPLNAPRAPGMLTDYGAVFDYRRGGNRYGWNTDHTARAVDLNVTKIQRNDTFIRMPSGSQWEIEVPNGQYSVYLVAGDLTKTGERMALSVEGQLAIAGATKGRKPFIEGAITVEVTDGRLTVASAGEFGQDKINYLAIQSTHEETNQLSVSATIPDAKEEGPVSGEIRIQRSGDLSAAVTVPLTVTGTATNGVDYGRIGNRLTFAAGQSIINLPVHIAGDSLEEGNETVIVTAGGVPGYTIPQPSGTVTIADAVDDNEEPPPPPLGTLSWTTSTPLPIGKAEAFGKIVNDKLYVFGGYVDNSFKPVNTAHVFDYATKTWSSIASFPLAVSHVATASDDRYLYFVGGYPATANAQSFATVNAYRYDTVTNTYSSLPALPQARGAGAATLLGRTLFFMGGADAQRKDRAEVWSLDLDNTAAGWVAKRSLPEARNHPAAVTLNGSVYFLGGQTGQDQASAYKSNLWRYDASSNQWTTLQSLPAARSHITDSTFIHAGRIITMGGEGVAQAKLRNVSVYDPQTDTWTSATQLPAPRFSGIADILSNGQVLFTSGYNNTFEKTTWIGTFA